MADTFGEWIKAERQARGWTIQQCAGKAGLRWQAWARLEHDEPKSQSGRPPQRRRDTAIAVAKGLGVDEGQVLAAAGLRQLAAVGSEAIPEEDAPLFEAIAQLNADDKKALQTLVSHFKTRSHVSEESDKNAEADRHEMPLPDETEESDNRAGLRTLGIDLDSGYLHTPDGSLLSEAQLPQIAEWIGQMAAIYARSKYALSETQSILAQIRQELRLPEPAAQEREEGSLRSSNVRT